MPTFAAPYFLVLLAVVPVVVWLWLRHKRAALRFSDTRLLAGLERGRAAYVRPTGGILRTLILCLVIIALAGPRWPDARTRLPTESIAVALVLDVSRSMDSKDFLWNHELITRLQAAQKAFRSFVAGGQINGQGFAGRGDDLVSLTVFSTHPETACPLTMDHKTLLAILDKQKAKLIAPETTTNTGDAIAWAAYQLEHAPVRRKVMIFVSDGEHNVQPPALKPRQAAQLAGNLGIPIYAIDANSGVAEQSAEALKAKESMQQIAAISKGRYFRADDLPSLLTVCAEIDRLERDPNLSYRYRRYHEGYVWFALAALGLVMVVVALETTVWRVSP